MVEVKDLEEVEHLQEDTMVLSLGPDILERLGFEGGQMPLYRRVPKFGFTSPNRVETKPINLDTLQALAEKTKASAITVRHFD